MENFIFEAEPSFYNELSLNKQQETSNNNTGDYYFAHGFQKMKEKDYEGAAKMFELGVKLNHLLCQKYYASALISGKGTQKDEDEGWKLLLKTAFEGDWDCECTFNEMDSEILKQKTYEEAWQYMIRASKKNNIL